jgi:hypothetical protein
MCGPSKTSLYEKNISKNKKKTMYNQSLKGREEEKKTECDCGHRGEKGVELK